ncbi:hypothetical protein QR680_017666 [Steinernema hermaphroditum]|uniref:Major facilitator superfamily (MFS) profile domain-containing protein n=1 Tax=Steinernema hermaphroditum TaxID=289476 RepID=A0AA39LP23_9BILA|nr:hypothetical protein QR680_017666 [Steinernema hermaphroditum]
MGLWSSNVSESSSEELKQPRSYCSNAVLEFDEVFDRTGHYGRYQLFALLVIQYAMINAAGNYVFVSFASLKPSCSDPSIERISDTCTKISLCPANSTISVFHSLYEEEDFVCPNSYLPQHMQTVQAIGSGIGAILGGHLADVYGRKWVSYSGAVLMGLFGLAGGVSLSWEMLLFSMLGMGFSYGMLVDASMTLASETAGPKYRIVQTLAFQWSLALQIASLIAYLTANWRTYLLTINALCAPVLVLMFFWIESPRWLIQKRRYAEAAKELTTLSSWNRVDLHFTADDLTSIQVQSVESAQVFSIWHLVSTRKLICYTLVMVASALTVEMCVAVIIFDVQVLAGNPFLNIALYGILRLWVPLFIVFMEARSNWFGRRVLFISSQCESSVTIAKSLPLAITAVCYALVLALSVYPESNTAVWIFRSCLAMIGGIVNSSIFFTVYKQYSIELYPTLMRAMAVGTFGVVERIGGALAPQLVNMNQIYWPGTAIAVTTVVIVLSLVTGFLILPETKNAAMPDVYRKKSSGAVTC